MVLGIPVKPELNLAEDVAPYLERGVIRFFEASDRNDVITKLIDHLQESAPIEYPEKFLEAVLKREEIASTGIGKGIAIPHAKLPFYDDFFISVGLLEKGVEWGALDGIPVQLIFLIGGPDDRQSHYLKLLSQLTLYLRDEETRKKLLTLTAPEQMIQIFKS